MQRGFSLIELSTVLAIMGVLLGIAAPGFRDFVLDSRRTAVVNDLLGAMHFARSEALKRGQTVIVCASADGLSCSTDQGDWAKGWLTYVNQTGSISPCVVDGTADVILRYAANDQADIRVKSNRDCYAFRPFTVHMAAGMITVCDPRANAQGRGARALIVSSVGRARISSTNGSQQPLNCS